MTEVFELPHKLELISEEKRPSLYSCSSMTTSICSDSTIDLDEFDHIHSTIQDSFDFEKKESKPLQNNFLNENQIEQPLDVRTIIEVETPEPSIKPVKQSHPAFSKSASLHDVSNLLPVNLTAKSNTVSCETINSQSLASTTKSKDSGFQRSLSCLSLTSGKRSYDHIQSKVKAYIQNIKETEALNKRNKLVKKLEKASEPSISTYDSEVVTKKDDLIKEIQELKHELHEKSLYIDAQQRNYNKLLLKLAEARNIIDKLRVQSMSHNYSYENESKHQISSSLNNMNFDTFDSNLSRSFRHLGSCITEEDASETTDEAVKNSFNPQKHSSPYEKSLSPVSKMFSSSSRLNKNYQPLTNPKQSKPQCRSQTQNIDRSNTVAKSYDGISKTSCLQLSNHTNLLRHQTFSTGIDLPNDDPFDKVKKWQASLPSINLLGSNNTSDCEDPELNLSCCPQNSKTNENSSSSKLFAKPRANENEISNILSQELRSKCKITESDVTTEEVVMLKNNEAFSRTYREERFKASTIYKRKGNEEVASFINNKITAFTSRQELNPEKSKKINKPLNCIKRGNSVEVMFPFPDINKLTNSAILHSKESSVSEDVSTYLPKSSSLSNCRINNLENDTSDDSSSISSSVLGSDSHTPTRSPKRTKRRLVLCEDEISTKVPKVTKSKASQTTFVLREPKLNFIPHFENDQSVTTISNKQTKNYEETWLKHRDSKNNSMKTESSQRKAWNARNNTNFYVCKDFHFSKNSSLIECIKDMEGLVSKGALVIRSVVDRNNTMC